MPPTGAGAPHSPSLLDAHHRALHRFATLGWTTTYGCLYSTGLESCSSVPSSTDTSHLPSQKESPAGIASGASITSFPGNGAGAPRSQRSDVLTSIADCPICWYGELSMAATRATVASRQNTRASSRSPMPDDKRRLHREAAFGGLKGGSSGGLTAAAPDVEGAALSTMPQASCHLHAKITIAYLDRLQGVKEWVHTYTESDHAALREVLPYISEDYMEYIAHLGARSGNMSFRQYACLPERKTVVAQPPNSPTRGRKADITAFTAVGTASPHVDRAGSVSEFEGLSPRPASFPVSFCCVPSLVSLTEVGGDALRTLLQRPRYVAGGGSASGEGSRSVDVSWASPRLFLLQAAAPLSLVVASEAPTSALQERIEAGDTFTVAAVAACDVYLVLTDDALTIWGCGAGGATGFFYVARSLEDYSRLGAAFGWIYGWQLCYSSRGPPQLSLPWLKLFNESALMAALRLHDA